MPLTAEPFSWDVAHVDGFGVFVALAGTSTTGKTVSALRMGQGLVKARGGELAVLDTEGGRTHHYADRFKFRVSDMAPPFHPEKFALAAESAEKRGFAGLVIDNFSLEWSGPGGVLAMQEDDLANRVARDNREIDEETKRFKHTRASWIKPKEPHKKMMQSFLQRRIPIFFCIRCNFVEAFDAAGAAKGGVWKSEQDKRFIYEWTVSWTLHPDTPGKPRRDLRGPIGPAFKCGDEHASLFADGKFIDEAAGEGLWRWANSNAAPQTPAETGVAKHAPADAAKAPAGDSSLPAGAGPDIFPGDIPSEHEENPQAERAKAFAAELMGELLQQSAGPKRLALTEVKGTKARLKRLSESYPLLHKQLMDVAETRASTRGTSSARTVS
jgi:hypothetical protein